MYEQNVNPFCVFDAMTECEVHSCWCLITHHVPIPHFIIRHLSSLVRPHFVTQARTARFYSATPATPVVKTFENQSKIPRLPIPSLSETAARYKKSLLPILGQTEFSRAEKAVNEFIKPGGLGETLQKRLHEMDRTEKVRTFSMATNDNRGRDNIAPT